MSHTEWHLIPDGMCAVSDNSGMHSLIADLSNSGLPRQEAEDAVKRLVTCWNEHDDLVKERDELVALLYDLLSVVDVDPELAQYPAAKATRELLAEKYPEAS